MQRIYRQIQICVCGFHTFIAEGSHAGMNSHEAGDKHNCVCSLVGAKNSTCHSLLLSFYFTHSYTNRPKNNRVFPSHSAKKKIGHADDYHCPRREFPLIPNIWASPNKCPNISDTPLFALLFIKKLNTIQSVTWYQLRAFHPLYNQEAYFQCVCACVNSFAAAGSPRFYSQRE